MSGPLRIGAEVDHRLAEAHLRAEEEAEEALFQDEFADYDLMALQVPPQAVVGFVCTP